MTFITVKKIFSMSPLYFQMTLKFLFEINHKASALLRKDDCDNSSQDIPQQKRVGSLSIKHYQLIFCWCDTNWVSWITTPSKDYEDSLKKYFFLGQFALKYENLANRMCKYMEAYNPLTEVEGGSSTWYMIIVIFTCGIILGWPV